MSTRYVWEKFQAVTTPALRTMMYVPTSGTRLRNYDYYNEVIDDSVIWYSTVDSITFPIVDGSQCIQLNSISPSDYANANETITIPKGKFIIFRDQNTYPSVGDTIRYTSNNFGRLNAFKNVTNADLTITIKKVGTNWDIYAPTNECLAWQLADYVTIRGTTSYGYATNSDKIYPDDSFSGSYWYVFKGQDNIDPTVAISAPRGGQPMTITVTPSTGKVYGGNVSYVYQVSIDGGANWQTLITTAGLSTTYTVPKGTPTIQARVQARDNLGFTSTDWVTTASTTVINNEPPTAPGSITCANITKGQTGTITVTAATDPDGTVAGYIYERSIDGSAFTEIHRGNVLTFSETISADWAMVRYRVAAYDDQGAVGPYITGEDTVVNSGWVYLSGPGTDLGAKPGPFDYSVTVGITGATGVTGIAVSVKLDGAEVYSGSVDQGTVVTVPMDTRLMRAGEHTVEVSGTKTGYLAAQLVSTFTVPTVTLPDGGRFVQLENQDGVAEFPLTLARAVIGPGGKDVNEILEKLNGGMSILEASAVKIETGSFVSTGTGRYFLTASFRPKFVVSNSIDFASNAINALHIANDKYGWEFSSSRSSGEYQGYSKPLGTAVVDNTIEINGQVKVPAGVTFHYTIFG